MNQEHLIRNANIVALQIGKEIKKKAKKAHLEIANLLYNELRDLLIDKYSEYVQIWNRENWKIFAIGSEEEIDQLIGGKQNWSKFELLDTQISKMYHSLS